MRLSATLTGTLALGGLIACMTSGAAKAQTDLAAPAADGWEFNVTPYLWLAGLGGKVTTQRGTSASFNQSFGDVLSHLNAALMLTADAQYQRWVVMTDFDYASMSATTDRKSEYIGESGATVTSYIGTITGGYRLIDTPAYTLDGMAGLRVMSIDTKFNFSGGLIPAMAFYNGDTWVNPIVAARGKLLLGDGFFLNGYADIGAGGNNDLTWQLYGGAGYTINPQFSAYAGYRYLEMQHNDHNLTLNIDEQGPLLGASYRF